MGAKPHRYTIAIDFDGVLHSYTSKWTTADEILDPPVEGAIEWLTRMSWEFDIAIYSTRAETEAGRLAIGSWISKNGFAGSVTITEKKPMALVYIDDRGWRFEGPGTFPSAEQIRAAVPWNKR